MKTECIGIRITSELKEKLEKLAASENRPFSNYIETLLIAHVNRTGCMEIKHEKFLYRIAY